MRILRPVVSPAAGAIPTLDPEITRGDVVSSEIGRDQILRHEAIFLQQLRINFSTAALFRLVLGRCSASSDSCRSVRGKPRVNLPLLRHAADEGCFQLSECRWTFSPSRHHDGVQRTEDVAATDATAAVA